MWPSRQESVDLVTFTEKIFNGKLYFLWSVANNIIPSEALEKHKSFS